MGQVQSLVLSGCGSSPVSKNLQLWVADCRAMHSMSITDNGRHCSLLTRAERNIILPLTYCRARSNTSVLSFSQLLYSCSLCICFDFVFLHIWISTQIWRLHLKTIIMSLENATMKCAVQLCPWELQPGVSSSSSSLCVTCLVQCPLNPPKGDRPNRSHIAEDEYITKWHIW